ncbi:ThuA domain-containing protein [Sphingobium sufflavum]|uniref:ThuA domain-containing protein n=1 Tax=Sphingobium sufflavum TaxID=1129547 RepID=UPI001F3F9E69|nr:ThuA domain-containing protein [Sphingobium sufflavum]MCE7795994.1 ThuA domain-containing protein [Sphingobium sufflavum]
MRVAPLMTRALRTLVPAVLALAVASPALAAPRAAAKPVDCALRDAPFSVESPLVDILLSPAARAIVDKAANGRLAKLPPQFAGTQAPTFAALMTLRQASAFTGLTPDAVAALDPQLRALPVTEADKVARCTRYDNDATPLPLITQGKPRILLFEKVNGFYHKEAIPAAHDAFIAMAKRKGWAIAATDKGGAITAQNLRRFDAVIWNNNSGDVLTVSQRKAVRDFVERGGGFVAIHGAGGDSSYFWDWYAHDVLGAQFKGHPMAPQFQDARVVVEAPTHPVAKGLPAEWTMTDEWYSFSDNPRTSGATVLLTLDEKSYKPGTALTMGDHPLAWTKCAGKGRIFYSAIGHRAESYAQPQHLALLESAITWAADKRQPCPAPAAR